MLTMLVSCRWVVPWVVEILVVGLTLVVRELWGWMKMKCLRHLLRPRRLSTRVLAALLSLSAFFVVLTDRSPVPVGLYGISLRAIWVPRLVKVGFGF